MNKQTLTIIAVVAVGAAGFLAWQAWQRKKAAENQAAVTGTGTGVPTATGGSPTTGSGNSVVDIINAGTDALDNLGDTFGGW
jgi:uncharacterized membrane protein YebE (DUF533 family)